MMSSDPSAHCRVQANALGAFAAGVRRLRVHACGYGRDRLCARSANACAGDECKCVRVGSSGKSLRTARSGTEIAAASFRHLNVGVRTCLELPTS